MFRPLFSNRGSPPGQQQQCEASHLNRSGFSSSTKAASTQKIPSPRKNGYSGSSSRSCLEEALESLLLVRLRVACEFGQAKLVVDGKAAKLVVDVGRKGKDLPQSQGVLIRWVPMRFVASSA